MKNVFIVSWLFLLFWLFIWWRADIALDKLRVWEQYGNISTSTPTIHISVMRTFSWSREPWTKYIALTFDDGPHKKYTPKLLDTLKQYDVPATFYIIGINAQLYPDIIKRIHDEWHEIGTHSWTHRDFTKLSQAEIQEERDHLEWLIYKLTWSYPSTYRPPYGNTHSGVQLAMNRPAILWSIDSKDWLYRKGWRSMVTATTGVHNGSIILMHDIYDSSVSVVWSVIEKLQSEWYQFVTISDLLLYNWQSLAGTWVCTTWYSCKYR